MHSKMENSVNRLRVKQKINLNHKQTLRKGCIKILCYNSGMEEATEKTVKCQN